MGMDGKCVTVVSVMTIRYFRYDEMMDGKYATVVSVPQLNIL